MIAPRLLTHRARARKAPDTRAEIRMEAIISSALSALSVVGGKSLISERNSTTGDLGCIAVKREGNYSANETDLTTRQKPRITKREATKLANNLFLSEEMKVKNASSLVLVELIQAAIHRREALLRTMGEEPGLPAGSLVSVATAAAQRCTPLRRLALEEFTDQALAREDLESADLASARLDMAELLPFRAADPEYAATARAAARRSGEAMRTRSGADKPSADIQHSCSHPPHRRRRRRVLPSRAVTEKS